MDELRGIHGPIDGKSCYTLYMLANDNVKRVKLQNIVYTDKIVRKYIKNSLGMFVSMFTKLTRAHTP